MMKSSRLRWRRELLLVLCTTSVSCSPVVLHKAHVDPGTTLGVTAGNRASLCDTGCTAGVYPVMGFFAQYGITSPDTAGWSALVSATIPSFVMVPGTKLGLYVQAPAAPAALTFGVGASISIQDVMGYAEFGQAMRYGSWYVVQGIVRAAERPENDLITNGGRGGLFHDFVGATYWSPQIGFETRSGRYGFYVAGSFGRSAIIIDGADPDHRRAAGHRPVRVFAAGLSIMQHAPFSFSPLSRRR